MKQCRVISIGSGKGGVGKTTIAYSLAELFNKGGKKVLLIDFDLYTQGLSAFFEKEINDDRRKKQGLLDIFGDKEFFLKTNPAVYQQNQEIFYKFSKEQIKDIVLESDGIEIIPVSTKFFHKLEKLDEYSIKEIGSLLNSIIRSVKTHELYDYVIIDNHAGICDSLSESLKISDDFLIISESDQLSISISNKFQQHYLNATKKLNTFVIINKIFTENPEEYKNLVKYLGFVQILPPLPLDYEVMRKFVLRSSIMDFDNPSAFFFAMVNIVERLFPKSEVVINLKNEISDNILEPVVKEIKKIKNQLHDIDVEIDNIKHHYEHKLGSIEKKFNLIFPPLIMILLFSIGLFTTTKTMQYIFSILILFLIAGVVGTVMIYLYSRVKVYSEEMENREESDSREKELQAMRFKYQEELHSYNGLLTYGDIIKTEKLIKSNNND